MIRLDPITEHNVLAFKAVRLAALRESPTAFESTYDREKLFTDEEWMERARKWNGAESVAYLAQDGGDYCGIAAGVLDDDNKSRAYLLSMWVAPLHHRRGIGRILVNAILNWAQQMNTVEIQLDVTSNNDVAVAFYERLGFRKTGRLVPHPHDHALREFEMTRAL